MRPKYAILAKLPKAKRWASVNDRYQIPGVTESLFPGYRPTKILSKDVNLGKLLDPTHPATKLHNSKFPTATTLDNAFRIRVFPMAILTHGVTPFPTMPILTWDERVQKAHEAGFSAAKIKGRTVLCKGVDESGLPQLYTGTEQVYPEHDHHTFEIPARNALPKGPYLHYALKKLARRVPMSFSTATSKKRMGSLAFVRAKIIKRIRGALDLIVSRGARVVKPHGQDLQIILDEDDAGRKWSMQGWTYMLYPTTDIYRMSLANLITLVRRNLEQINREATSMENAWLAESLLYNNGKNVLEPPLPLQSAKDSTSTSRDSEGGKPSGTSRPSKPTPSSTVSQPAPQKMRVPPFSSTGSKDSKVWERELKASMALLAKQLEGNPPMSSSLKLGKNRRQQEVYDEENITIISYRLTRAHDQ